MSEYKGAPVQVIGAGLAGVEAAACIAAYGIPVILREMKPEKKSAAHKLDTFAELVCSNSLKANRLESAAGMLKAEMRLLGALTLRAADHCAVPAGGALAVDRNLFSDWITNAIRQNPLITVVHEETAEFPRENAVIATGPLTSDRFAECIAEKCGRPLSFYDAAAPIVSADSLDRNILFSASRYGKGEADYLNCPMDKAEYTAFYDALIHAESVPLHDFEDFSVYEGCMPIEVLAKRGVDSVRYACMKPVGLTDPHTGKRPYAVVQLRMENNSGTMYNLVGFQTNLRFAEQARVFRMIPGLAQAEFVRYGVMHRNTFLDSPRLLDEYFCFDTDNQIYFAGQMTGVEGYMESAAAGLLAGHAIARRLLSFSPLVLPEGTMTGALCRYISDSSVTNFQPMGANMGLLPAPEERIKGKQERYAFLANRGLAALRETLGGLASCPVFPTTD